MTTTVANIGDRLTITVTEAADILGVSRDNAYAAIRSGAIPSLRFGRRIVVPVGKLLELLGVPALSNVPEGHVVEQPLV